MEAEGVIKFDLVFEPQAPPDADITRLRAWRRILYGLQLVGQDPQRYGGLGFGNLSMRTSRGFLISGTQTGKLSDPGIESYAEVVGWSLGDNRVVARGMVKPSSESLTHAAVYALSGAVQYVFHVHSPDIWRKVRPGIRTSRNVDVPKAVPKVARNVDVPKAVPKAVEVGKTGNVDVPETGEGVAYGTPAMAAEVKRVCAGRPLPNLFVMGGHEDGVVSYAADASDAGLLLVKLLAESLTNP